MSREVKERLRKEARAHLAEISPEERRVASKKIQAALRWEIPLEGLILLYLPLPDEPDLESLVVLLAEKDRLVVPAMEGPPLRLVSARDLARCRKVGKLRVPPAEAPVAQTEAIRLAVIPGLAFDSAGMRLGRGGGYFDRILGTTLGCPTIGVFFACQRVEFLPREAHDRGVDRVLTEEGWLTRA